MSSGVRDSIMVCVRNRVAIGQPEVRQNKTSAPRDGLSLEGERESVGPRSPALGGTAQRSQLAERDSTCRSCQGGAGIRSRHPHHRTNAILQSPRVVSPIKSVRENTKCGQPLIPRIECRRPGQVSFQSGGQSGGISKIGCEGTKDGSYMSCSL